MVQNAKKADDRPDESGSDRVEEVAADRTASPPFLVQSREPTLTDVRLQCLRAAVETTPGTRGETHYLARARAFENWVLRDEQQTDS